MKVDMDPKLKPLYANLLRLGIGNYLISERFNHLCIENNVDQLCIIPKYKYGAEKVLGVFLTELFNKDPSLFISILSKIIIDFADWSDETKDFSKVIENLFNLGYTENDLEEILAWIKKRKLNSLPSKKKVPKLKIEKEAIDETLCFVLMPFDEKFLPIYDSIIKKVVGSFKLKCTRADEIFDTKPIIEDILEHIQKARVIIADLTGRNPNVFYELGLAHAMGKEVILITQNLKDVPFDIKHLRCIDYEDSVAGAEKLRERLTNTLKTIISKG